MVVIKLLEEDQNSLLLEGPPITIVSFYHVSETCQETTNITEYLTNRAVEILKANSWLCGRLIKDNIDNKIELCLSYNEEVTNPQAFIHNITNDNLFAQKDWKNIGAIIPMYGPKRCKLCVDKDEQLCAFVIFQNTELTELALSFSMNHSIGDGYTLYYLWKMLDRNEKIYQMQVERDYEFIDYVKRDTNFYNYFEQYNGIANILKVFAGMITRGIGRSICQKSPPRVNIFKVNSEVIKRIKEENNSEDSFVSTNDILNSWFFGGEACNADNIVMAINMRNRLPEIRENMAGNYEIMGLLRSSDVINPKTFRQKWTDVMSKKQLPSEIPSFKDFMKHTSGNVTSNWATFFHQIDLIGFQHDFHMPVFKPNAFGVRFAGIPICSECGMIIFKMNRDEHAIFSLIYNDLADDYFDNCEIVEEIYQRV